MNEPFIRNRELIGIISDSHDNIPMIDKAVKQLNEFEVKLVLHAGDYISPFTVQHFKGLKAKLVGVYGNNCAERAMLKRLFLDIGADIRGFFAEVNVEGVKIALLHGHEKELLSSLADSAVYDLVICGHTHRRSIQRKGKTMIVNPGEICGYLSGKSTMMIFNTKTRKIEMVTL